MMLHQLSDH